MQIRPPSDLFLDSILEKDAGYNQRLNENVDDQDSVRMGS